MGEMGTAREGTGGVDGSCSELENVALFKKGKTGDMGASPKKKKTNTDISP